MTDQERLEKLEQLLQAFNRWMKDPSYGTFQPILLLQQELNSDNAMLKQGLGKGSKI